MELKKRVNLQRGKKEKIALKYTHTRFSHDGWERIGENLATILISPINRLLRLVYSTKSVPIIKNPISVVLSEAKIEWLIGTLHFKRNTNCLYNYKP